MNPAPGRAVFLDRDGIVNELVQREGRRASPRRAEDFRILPGTGEAVARLRAAGFGIFIVTNQPDIARGFMASEVLDAMHLRLDEELGPDAIAVCRHDDADDCACRKPKPGMLLDLASRHAVALDRSIMVGDSWRDIGAGRAAGCRTVLVGREPDQAARDAGADQRAETLMDAVALIERSM